MSGKKSARKTAPGGPPEAPSPAPFAATVLTIFPEAFPGSLALGLHGKALRRGLWILEARDLREYGLGLRRSLDAPPYGGGAGMILRADALAPALDAIDSRPGPLLHLSPRGAPLTQGMVRAFSRGRGLRLLCGRYEGVDQRLLDAYAISEVSLGDFVLSGGEVAALALLEAVVRLLPGVLGNERSASDESFARGVLEHPQYTRPATWRGIGVPEVLRGGDHGRIARWRAAQSRALTRRRRPDLWARRGGVSGAGPGADGNMEDPAETER